MDSDSDDDGQEKTTCHTRHESMGMSNMSSRQRKAVD